MVIIDFNQMIISLVHAELRGSSQSVDVGMLRHLVFSKIRSIKMKFEKEYGELVFACDGYNYWRKDIFPYYKAKRKESRDKSGLDWNSIFRGMDIIRDELERVFPYRVLRFPKVEADDIIGTLAHRYGNPLNTGERVLILSKDKDFIQLHIYGNVKQFDPIDKKWVTHVDPKAYLDEHVMRGDVGDGVPNILSDDDTLINPEKRQKTLTGKRLKSILTGETIDDTIKRNIVRNQVLIDLTRIPKDIQDEILLRYDEYERPSQSGIMNYFIENSLSKLFTQLGDFYIKG